MKEREPGTVRYCPECSSIGDVPHTALDCCPDGSKAVYVSEEVAQLAYIGFKALWPSPGDKLCETSRAVVSAFARRKHEEAVKKGRTHGKG